MTPSDSWEASGFAGPQTESRSCSGSGTTRGGGGAGGNTSGGAGGGAAATWPRTVTGSARAASDSCMVAMGESRSPLTSTSTVAVENPSNENVSVTCPAGNVSEYRPVSELMPTAATEPSVFAAVMVTPGNTPPD